MDQFLKTVDAKLRHLNFNLRVMGKKITVFARAGQAM